MLNVAVALAGLGLGVAGVRRGFFLAGLVPLALAPFSYGRWRVHRTLERSLGDGWGQRLLAACGIASRPVRLSEAERRLQGTRLSEADLDAAGEAAKAAVSAPDDFHATNAYRKRLLAALLRRTVERAADRARQGASA